MRNRLKKYLSREIVIEYKACLYFCCLLFFYFCYLAFQGIFSASVPVMCEMILTAYAAGYLQVYAFRNFDDAERMGAAEAAGMFLCAGLYTAVAWILSWFGHSKITTALFFLYLVFIYVCVYLLNKLKRRIDTEALNKMLEDYKGVNRDE
ncbi:MAG: DUF3021 family protein [Lachnospiraceae bacterium]|nr:DUF3021 family protein [Lachnospiraceae bacterium]